MSDAVATPAKTAPKKKAAAKPKKPSTHPKYSEMIQKAIGALKERGGSSRQAILKYVCREYSVGTDERTINAHLKMALRAGVKNGSLKQSKGTGASGSFRIGEKAVKPKTAKKPAAAKPAAAKKAKKPAKPAAKKAASPKKKAVKKPSTPKKAAAKKPAAKKAKAAPAKKAASPKKAAAKKPAAKKPAAKKPAAKKPAAKKAAKK